MEWSDRLAIGNNTIDSQHKELFKRINSLVQAIKEHRCKDEIDGVIKFLEDYARVHFAEEEKQMREAGYPDLEEQRQEHKKYLDALKDLKEQAALPRVHGSSYDLSAATNQVIVDWIVEHIMKVDTKFGAYLRSAKFKRSDFGLQISE